MSKHKHKEKGKEKDSRRKHLKKSKSSSKRKKNRKKSQESVVDPDAMTSSSKSTLHKRKRCTSSNSSSSSSYSNNEAKINKKKKKHIRKPKGEEHDVVLQEEADMNVPLDLMGPSTAMRPQTREEWQQKQEQIKRVLDPETGRYRLIKGDGEVLEEIVSRNQHKAINKKATEFDGQYFEERTVRK